MVSYIAWVRVFSFKKIVPIIKNQAVNLQTNRRNVSQRASHFLVVLLLIFSTKIFSQQQLPRIAQNSPHTLDFFSAISAKDSINQYARQRILIGNGAFPVSDNTGLIQILRPGCYTSKLPFFCKKEWQFEKNTSLPLRLRLGSLDYVNKLEGKK